MKLSKILVSLTLLLLLVPLVLLNQKEVIADESRLNEVSVVIHKRVFEDKLPNPLMQNTGQEMPDFWGQPLDGAGFTVFDVTDLYHAALIKSNQEAAMNKVIASYQAKPTDFKALSKEQFTGNPNGTTTFIGLPTVSGGKDAAYLFIETTIPKPTDKAIVQKSAPILLALPIQTKGISDTVIHVYPKNISEKKATPSKPIPPKPTPPTGRLPQTGEVKTFMGISGMLIVGAVSVIWYKRRRKNAAQ